MSSTVRSLLAAAKLDSAGVVRWGESVPLDAPGVYVVSLTDEPDSHAEVFADCPLSRTAVRDWLENRPELLLDGKRPTVDALARRVASFWLFDEVVLYIGLAGISVQRRVRQYYVTPLGAARPHAGGHFIRTLENLDELFVHFAAAAAPAAAEYAMLEAFCRSVSSKGKNLLRDPSRPFPFANLEWPRGVRKRHGISGAKGDITRDRGRPRQARRWDEPRARRPKASREGGTPVAGSRPTLHEEIARILREHNNTWMTTQAIANAVNAAGNYEKRDRSAVTAFQVHGRTRNYAHLFERDGTRVRLNPDAP